MLIGIAALFCAGALFSSTFKLTATDSRHPWTIKQDKCEVLCQTRVPVRAETYVF